MAISVGTRYGADPQKLVEKFAGMRCPNPRKHDANGPGADVRRRHFAGLAKTLELALGALTEARAGAYR